MRIFRPIDDQLLARQPDPEQRQGALYIPDRAQERPLEAVVVAVGPGRLTTSGERVPMSVRTGDVILFRRYAGEDVAFDGVPCMILREADVLGIVTDADAPLTYATAP